MFISLATDLIFQNFDYLILTAKIWSPHLTLMVIKYGKIFAINTTLKNTPNEWLALVVNAIKPF